MKKIEKPWWRLFDRWILALFTAATCVINGPNQLRVLGILLVLTFAYNYTTSRAAWAVSNHPKELTFYALWGLWTGVTGVFVCSYLNVFWDNYEIVLQMIVMLFTVYGLLRLRMTERLVYWALILAGCIQMVATLLGYSQDKAAGIITRGIEVFGETRVSGLTGNANSLGFILVAGFACVMQLWKMKKSPFSLVWKGLLITFSCAAVYMIFETGSRKTTVGIGLMITGWLAWLLPQGKGISSFFMRLGVLIGLLAVCGAVLAFVANDTIVGKRFNELFERGHGSLIEGVERDSRAEMYRGGFEMFVEHPICGVGLGHFVVYFWEYSYSHSDYIEPLACTGLVGFILYHGFNVCFLLRLLRLRRRIHSGDERYKIDAMLLSLFVSLLLGMGSPYWSSQRQFILMTTFVTYAFMLERKLKGLEPLTDQDRKSLGLPRAYGHVQPVKQFG